MQAKLLWMAAVAAMMMSGHARAADAFPQRNVTVVVPYAAGGVTDYFARVVGARLAEKWGKAVVIDNRAGAGTIIGTQLVSKAPADGYTLLFTSYGYTTNPVLRKNLPYSAASFRPVALLGASHNVLLVTNRLKGQPLQTLIEQARQTPGSLKLASSGLASSPHIGAEFFAKETGITFTHVPYKGQGPAMVDLGAGVVDGMFDGMSSYSHVQGGQVAAVAIAAPRRHPAAPEIPTFQELGVNLVSGTWFGWLAPAGTPDVVVQQINADIRTVLQEPQLQAQIAKTGMVVATAGPADFGDFLEREAAKLQALVQQGVQIDLN